jgi:hypothetical protein
MSLQIGTIPLVSGVADQTIYSTALPVWVPEEAAFFWGLQSLGLI